ncbi:MAG: 50S ribosomal protein L10 [Patescibacteria group bacterium]
MAKTKIQKKAILERLVGAFKGGNPSVFVHFRGVSVADETAMRRSLRDMGIAYFVAKKTLIIKALNESGLKGSVPELGGEVAVAYATGGTDTTAPARELHVFMKKFGAERFSILGGIFEEKIQGKEQILEVATIPTMTVLRGMFANVINSPIQRFVVALDQIAQKKA